MERAKRYLLSRMTRHGIYRDGLFMLEDNDNFGYAREAEEPLR